MKSFQILSLGLLLAAVGCGEDGNPIDAAGKFLAEQCGIGCPGDEVDGVEIKGVLEGNAAISGVPEIDAFFQSVINFKSAADGVSAGLEAQLDLIRDDFSFEPGSDVSVELKKRLDANLEGGAVFTFTPGRCSLDARASVEAQARCEAKVTPGSVMVDCKGACEVDPGKIEATCTGGVDVQCSFTGPTVDCQGSCEGSCEAMLEGSARCGGTCRGECTGNCSLYDGQGKCAGACEGMCTGSCEAKIEGSAKCEGTCKGSCTVTNPEGGCSGAAHAECVANARAPSVKCEGRCEGEIEPPKVEAQCQATARAEARLNVQCTPPRLSFEPKFKASLSVETRADLEADLDALVNIRLPALLQAAGRADAIGDAGDDLGASARAAIEAAFKAFSEGKRNFRTTFGISCAVEQLEPAGDTIQDSREQLASLLMEVQDVRATLGLPD